MTEELMKEVDKIKWWHSIDLGDGIITKGCSHPTSECFKLIKMPQYLNNKSVLDIGAADGYYCFEAEKMGAKRVVALDTYKDIKKDGFLLAKKVLKSSVECVEMDVADITPDNPGKFDIVLFLGLIYNMKNPLMILEKIYNVTLERLIIETFVDMIDYQYPAMRFYPTTEYHGDPNIWWGINPMAMVDMLKVVGFKRVDNYGINKYDRCVFHAWR